MERVNMTTLAEAVSIGTGTPFSTTKKVLKGFLEEVKTKLKKGDRVNLTGFISLGTKVRGARKARNPKTGESIKVPATTGVRVKVSTSFKDMLNKKRKRRTATSPAAKKANGKKAPAKRRGRPRKSK